MTRTRSERPQWRQTIYHHAHSVLCVTCVGQCWLSHRAASFPGRQVSRSFAASLLRDWRKGGAR